MGEETQIKLVLTSKAVENWVLKNESNLAEAITRLIEKDCKEATTPFDIAVDRLRSSVQALQSDAEFTLKEAIGFAAWNGLAKGESLALGRYVMANQEAFGVEFLRKNSANHAVYRRMGGN